MNLLVIGSGGREHALVWALRKGHDASLSIACAQGNAGIAEIAECVQINPTDTGALAEFAVEKRIDLTIVGPEAPLALGLVDEFERRGLLIAGANQMAARLEASKAFAKDFMARHNIPTARYQIVSSPEEAQKILNRGEFGTENDPVVVKADGLAAGKGVVVARSRAEAEEAINDLMVGGAVGAEAARRVIIEEALAGREASLLLFSDGRDYALMPAARDHKRIGEGDTGPNTGGMGAITDASVLDEETLQQVVREIVEPTLEGARADGFAFRGVLFIGLMLTEEGARVLEYNVRFGDPEAQAILVRLESNLIEIMESVARGAGLDRTEVRWSDESSACVVLAARGYPARPETGDSITGLKRAAEIPGVQIFHAGTARSAEGQTITSGGRVLGITSSAVDLDTALRRCYDTIDCISWNGMQYRRDIGRFGGRKK
ncbi:MAG: phosphoribosylamine--glycine ligase [Acidobacteria bacterium 13_1_20CM_3_53_8]|nr:MAG: phosphoribosylamine--glycine ligase [Acidobacteria bacterium 13_1_20CM_3_53_8]